MKIKEFFEFIKPGVGAVLDSSEDAIIYLLILDKLIRTRFNNLLPILSNLLDSLLLKLDF